MLACPRCQLSVAAAIAVLLFVGVGVALAQEPIFVDDFENGTVGEEIGSPWGTQASADGMATYASDSNPFPSGSQYALFRDDSTSGFGIRHVSSGPANPLVAGNVTTFSFDFWEPDPGLVTAGGGLLFGYSHNNELNSTGRNFSAQFRDGQLVGGGSSVQYDRNAANTVFMIANDTDAPLVDYQPGRTLESKQADLWISLSGAAPEFAFSATKANPTGNPRGIGFRSFGGDVEEVWVDNVLLLPGATFNRQDFVACDPGDVNCDGFVMMDDFDIIHANFRQSPALRSEGDLSGDSLVSLFDFVEWKTEFLNGGGSLAGLNFGFLSVPEPSSVLLAMVAMLGLTGCRWRRRGH